MLCNAAAFEMQLWRKRMNDRSATLTNRHCPPPCCPLCLRSNVLIDEEGRACLADLALAKVLASQPARTAAGATYTYAGEHAGNGEM